MTVGIGSAVNRVDGHAKVTGTARYAAEHPVADLLFGVVVSSPIARGKIKKVNTDAALRVPGVIDVITHKNRPHVAWFSKAYHDEGAPPGSPFRPLYDAEIHFSAQPIALVVAETFEAARYAATLVEFEFEAAAFNTSFLSAQAERFVPRRKRSGYVPPKSRGDAAQALREAPVTAGGEYALGTHHHNPMEMHATTAIWKSDGITVYDKTQGPQNVQRYLCGVFGLSADEVTVLNPYVGGAFGSGLRPQYQVFLAVLAAKMLERSVRVVLTRQQMFSHVHRPPAIQTISLGADKDGKLLAIRNTATTATSRFENYMETVVNWGLMNYACPNAEGEYAIAPMDTYTPGDMRAPGAGTGMTLFEIAIDEVAFACGVDPLEFRLLNYSEKDAMNNASYTSKELRKAYQEGADAFGWSMRSAAPRSMTDGEELIGYGMATGMWEALFQQTSARAKLGQDGRLEISSASSDIGTGTYTVMAQVAAGVTGLPIEQIDVKLGDSRLPTAPVEGGSWMAASTGAAVELACKALMSKLVKLAISSKGGPLAGLSESDVSLEDGVFVAKGDQAKRIPIEGVLTATSLQEEAAEATAKSGWMDVISEMRKSRNSHSAVFAEVRVDGELGIVRVTRIVSAVAGGRIINPKTARSQILGGVVMGIGMALHEETLMDTRLGRFMNHSFADYHIPVNADVPKIEVIFVEERDDEVSPLGVKGLGEIGIVGTAAAVANAIFHATGKRIRSLPVTLDKILHAPEESS